MSGYRPGPEPYIDYAAQPDDHSEERVYGTSQHPELQHVGAPGNIIQGLEAHRNQLHAHQQQHHQQQQPQQQQVLLDPRGMAHHPSPQFGGGQQMPMSYGPGPLQQQQQQPQTGQKRSRPHEELELDQMGVMPEGQMHGGEMGSLGQQGMVSYGAPTPQTFHSHALPNQGPRSKMPRLSEPEPNMMSQAAPSVVGTAGMPHPAPRPRGPKLKFTPEDDQLLVDLKENRSLTWKQIAEFFPGRSSGTLQVRYCTKLKAKTTQWTDETVSLGVRVSHLYKTNHHPGTKAPRRPP